MASDDGCCDVATTTTFIMNERRGYRVMAGLAFAQARVAVVVDVYASRARPNRFHRK